MDKIARSFFSMRMMAVGMFIFLFAIGLATIIESAYDIQTAKVLIYNAFWFEVLLAYLGVNLIANIFTYQMYKREKIAVLMFHLSFIVMLIGAAITRFVSFEGLMLIRENSQTDYIYSSDPHLWFKINDGKLQYTYSEKMFMSQVGSNDFNIPVDFPEHKTPISIEFVEYQRRMVDSLVVNDSIVASTLEIVTGGMTSNYLSQGGFLMIGDVAMSFDKKDAMPGIEIVKDGAKLMMKTQLPMSYLAMATLRQSDRMGGVSDSMYTQIPMDTLVPFQTQTLYRVGQNEFVFKDIKKHAKVMRMPSGLREVGEDFLIVKVTDGDQSKIVELEGGMGAIPQHEVFQLNGLTYEMEYGSMRIQLPFAIACRDFQLDKYPGSQTPSSFASEVTIIDTINNVRRDKRIFMNNVIDYGGYRFFQSSYDKDEGGTHLSVNHDWLGTNLSYLGYLMMGIGMLLTLFSPTGRFRDLNQKLKKSRMKREKLTMTVIAALLISTMSFGQDHNHSTQTTTAVLQKDPIHRVMSAEHSEEVASMLVQDIQGRIIPFHTLADQLLRKIARDNKYEDLNAVQTIMSMHMYPDYWARQDIIYVSGKSNLREELNVENGMTSYADLTDQTTGEFKLLEAYKNAHNKLESKRGEYDKRLIQLGERYQVVQMIFSWNYMKIVPLRGEVNNTWFVPLNMELMKRDSSASSLALTYLSALNQASEDGKYGEANDLLVDFKKFQRDAASDIVPSESLVNMEISYNKMGVFKNSFRMYAFLGLFALLVFFFGIFTKPGKMLEKIFKRTSMVITVLVGVIFLYHGYGIYMRWAISGHAPWSNGYEAIVFISWVAVLTGLLFTRKNAVVLAGTAILAALMLYVSEMNLLDPEITQLQPVLKSYWLMIHVAIITGSYAPLGIACILSLLNMFLYTARTKRNGEIVTLNINELTYIAEMAMTIGVFMLAIGTFLGGIWANESWGRYWGWDPKETWALVAILVYAIILHFRYIPGMKGKFTFNVASLWGYSAILFTFFGVNFYLVGLHSYAQGEGLAKIPNALIVTVFIFIAITLFAYFRYRMYNARMKNELLDS